MIKPGRVTELGVTVETAAAMVEVCPGLVLVGRTAVVASVLVQMAAAALAEAPQGAQDVPTSDQ